MEEAFIGRRCDLYSVRVS